MLMLSAVPHLLYTVSVFVLCLVIRREVLKEKLREKLELEKRALQIVERLLEDSVAEDFFIDCVCVITIDCFT